MLHKSNITETVALLRRALAGLQLPLDDHQYQQLAVHFELLLQWNQRVSLTSLRGREEIASRHFAESLFLATGFTPPGSGLLVDVGSGAGFPGLPLKIAWPSLETVLLEPVKKKS